MKRIFITGGASGLGKALAERYGRDGYRVCIGDINITRGEATENELKNKKIDIKFLKCDVTKDADMTAARDWLLENWDGVDIVVNNAGVASSGRISEVPIEDWNWIIDVNLLGVVRGCRLFTPVFQTRLRSVH